MPYIAFEKTAIYQRSLELIRMVDFALRAVPPDADGLGEHGLAAELRTGSMRIPAMVARGYGMRTTRRDLSECLEKANHEIVELDQRIMIAQGMEYFDEVTADTLLHLTDGIGRLISGMLHQLRQRPRRSLQKPPQRHRDAKK